MCSRFVADILTRLSLSPRGQSGSQRKRLRNSPVESNHLSMPPAIRLVISEVCHKIVGCGLFADWIGRSMRRKMRRNLSGRVVMITGASRGIGRRVCERLSKSGAKLALTARSADDLEKVVGEARARGADAAMFPGDLTLPADRSRILAETVARFGGLDVLVNSAGVCSFGEFDTSTEAIVRRVMEVNFFAQAELIRLAHPHLLRSAESRATIGVPPSSTSPVFADDGASLRCPNTVPASTRSWD